MSTLDSHSTNGRGSESWSRSWTHLRVDRRSRGYCRVTFEHPPINTITAETVAELAELVGLIEQDPDLNVVVFDSANPDFYLAHYDSEHDPSRTASLVLVRGGNRHLRLLACDSARPVAGAAGLTASRRDAQPSDLEPGLVASPRSTNRDSARPHAETSSSNRWT
jgi:hypothetical protein